MPRIILCPVDGERMTTETRTNAAGDTLQRFLCPSGDYSTEWRPVTLAPPAPGDENLLLPENTEWFREATEFTAGRMESSLRQRIDDLLGRVGTVGGDNTSLLDNITRLYRAVDNLELTTENIRVEAGTINLNTDELEAVMRQVRDAVSGGTRVLTEEIQQRFARDGRAFMASSTKLTASLAGHFRSLIQNPAGSGRRIFLNSLIISLSAGPVWPQVYLNPTLNVPAVQRVPNNVLLGGAPSAATMFADVSTTNAMSGGTDLGLTLAAFAGRNDYKLPPFIIPPGTSLGINVPVAGAADAEIKAGWWEEDV